MALKKLISGLLILSQANFAFAASNMTSVTIATTTHTPEYLMVKRAIAIQGQDTTDAEKQLRLTTTYMQYTKTATSTDQLGALKQAFVDLGVYNKDQADSAMTDAQILATQVSKATTYTQQSQTMKTALETMSTLHPAGAQFSSCQLSYGLLASGFLVTMGIVWGNGGMVDSVQQPVAYDVAVGGIGIFVLGFIMTIARC